MDVAGIEHNESREAIEQRMHNLLREGVGR